MRLHVCVARMVAPFSVASTDTANLNAYIQSSHAVGSHTTPKRGPADSSQNPACSGVHLTTKEHVEPTGLVQ